MAVLLVCAMVVGCGAPKPRNRPGYSAVEIWVPAKPELPSDMDRIDVELIQALREDRSGIGSMPPVHSCTAFGSS